MAQPEMIRTTMEEQCHWQDHYDKFDRYDRDRPFTLEQSNMEEDRMMQMTSLHHEQLAVPTWKMPAIKNEKAEHSQPAPWQETTRGHAQSMRSTDANKTNPSNTTNPTPSTLPT